MVDKYILLVLYFICNGGGSFALLARAFLATSI